jgi:hypothetical protein
MSNSNPRNARRVARCCAVLALTALGTVPLGAATPPAQLNAAPSSAGSAKTLPSAVELERWRQSILHTKRPKKACFAATFPASAWTEVPCTKPPKAPFSPAKGPRGDEVGNGSDFSAEPASGYISQAEGWFDSVSGVTSETGQGGNVNGLANAFSLQLNSNMLETTACSHALQCAGWEQFVYSNTQCQASWAYPGLSSTACVFIEYWLIDYGRHRSCPSGWTKANSTDCVINSTIATPVPPQAATSLGSMTLTGQVAGVGGADDTVAATVGTTAYATPGDDDIPDLGFHWQVAEFNVFGDAGGSQAVFNSGSTLVVRTLVDSGTNDAPSCDAAGYTGETNNLTLTDMTVSPATAKWPSLIFTESNVTGVVPAGCANAVTLGDTHITTFDGLKYDFQACGDFVLLQAPNFEVQARQGSGAPTWPNAAVNKAVATRMGKTRVELYIQPTRLLIDGTVTALGDTMTQTLSTGVQVRRSGNEYAITSANGDSVRADLNSTWIDVTLGLGHTPAHQARGLLGNPQGNSQQLVTSAGAVLKEPLTFTDLYNTYGASWRVATHASLFTEPTNITPANPSRPFFASDLSPAVAAHALAVCKAAGITNQELLNDCTLDTTVLHDEAAVKAFTIVRIPLHVIIPTFTEQPGR